MKSLKNFLKMSLMAVIATGLGFTSCKDKTVHVQSVSLDKTDVRMFPGDTVLLKASIFPANAEDQTVSWSSSASDIVSVNPTTGEMIARAGGKAVITVRATDGGHTAACNVIVPAASGYQNTVRWVLTEDGTLTLEGSGATNTYLPLNTDRPWDNHGITVERLVVVDSVTVIGEYVFAGSKLQSVQMSNSVTQIGKNVFAKCDSLKTVKLSNALRIIPGFAFQECYALQTVVLPTGLETILQNAFEHCFALETIDIPGNVREMYHRSFGNCIGLTTITVHWQNAEAANISGNPFDALTPSNITLSVPKGTKEDYETHAFWGQFNVVERVQ